MNKVDSEFAEILEKAGYVGALNLVQNELRPLATKLRCALREAAWRYANQDEEQDTSSYQLFHALQKIPKEKRPVRTNEPL
jgi:hypothetical protein